MHVGEGETFVWNNIDSAQSTYEKTDDTIHRAEEIFNSIRIRNDFGNHKPNNNNRSRKVNKKWRKRKKKTKENLTKAADKAEAANCHHRHRNRNKA
jgi:hypothetical protein